MLTTYRTEGEDAAKFQQLKYLVAVAEYDSITEAARRLFASQPRITASIRDLEREMGVTVFKRTRKGVIDADEGQTLLGYTHQVLEQTELLEERYKNNAKPSPRFAVSYQHYFAHAECVGTLVPLNETGMQ